MAPIEKIYNEYYKDVYRFVLALARDEYIAEDVTQETFMKAIKAIDRFSGECDIRVWLCQIAKNTYYSFAKKSKREQPDEDELMRAEAVDCDFVKNCIDEEQAIKIHKIVHELKEPYKEVFNLRVFGELSFKQIATIYGKTESFARVTYHRAKMMIMDKMED